MISAINFENTDEMGCRIACGLISDISNNCPVTCWGGQLEQLVHCLIAVLTNENYEPEAKLVAIVALGDLCLTAE